MTTPLEQAAEKVLRAYGGPRSGIKDAIRACCEQCAKAALEKATAIAQSRADHAKTLMLSDEKGVTDARVAFQAASELDAKDIRNLDPAQIVKDMNHD